MHAIIPEEIIFESEISVVKNLNSGFSSKKMMDRKRIGTVKAVGRQQYTKFILNANAVLDQVNLFSYQ